MSSFKNFAPMLSSLQDQADGKGTIAGSPLEDFLSIAGYETPGSGGGGASAIILPLTNTGSSYESPSGSGDYSLKDLADAFAAGTIIRLVVEDAGYVLAYTVTSVDMDGPSLYAAMGLTIEEFFPINDPNDPGIKWVYD